MCSCFEVVLGQKPPFDIGTFAIDCILGLTHFWGVITSIPAAARSLSIHWSRLTASIRIGIICSHEHCILLRSLGRYALSFHHLILNGLCYFRPTNSCLLGLVLGRRLECFMLVLGVSTATLDKVSTLAGIFRVMRDGAWYLSFDRALQACILRTFMTA